MAKSRLRNEVSLPDVLPKPRRAVLVRQLPDSKEAAPPGGISANNSSERTAKSHGF